MTVKDLQFTNTAARAADQLTLRCLIFIITLPSLHQPPEVVTSHALGFSADWLVPDIQIKHRAAQRLALHRDEVVLVRARMQAPARALCEQENGPLAHGVAVLDALWQGLFPVAALHTHNK